MTKENIQSGFRKAGLFPYNPNAYLENQRNHKTGYELTALSLINHAMQQHPAICEHVPSVVRTLLPVLEPPQPDISAMPDKCNTCGSNLKKKSRQQALNTKAGRLLTDVELV